VSASNKSVVEGVNGIRPLSDKEFVKFQALIRKEVGINLSPAKKALLVGRLTKRLRERGLDSFGAYYRLVTEEDDVERIRMVDSICTNETHFFREPAQFEFLKDHAIPAWLAEAETGRRPRRIRVWSAGCSTGEEPNSLAMIFLDRFPPGSGWEIEILATDISTRVLEKARAATWPIAKSKEIPLTYLKRYMLRGTKSQEGGMRAGPELRQVIEYMRLNLNDDNYPVGPPFDAVFCRNVLIYFDVATKKRVIERLLGRMTPQGLLFLGHAESLAGLSERVRSVGPTIYVQREIAATDDRASRSSRREESTRDQRHGLQKMWAASLGIGSFI
jgi:chemotaxis protein methyltransferase CheR